jgi:LysR family glycine cleavage system transcriptional activator
LHSFDAFRKRTTWNEWLEAVSSKPSKVVPNLLFNDYQLVIQAALEGEGIALGWNLTAQMLLKNGSLVKPFDAEVSPGGAYFIVADEKSARSDSVKTLVKWLLAQTAELRNGK